MVKIKKQISRCAVVQQIRKSSRSENPADLLRYHTSHKTAASSNCMTDN